MNLEIIFYGNNYQFCKKFFQMVFAICKFLIIWLFILQFRFKYSHFSSYKIIIHTASEHRN